MEISSIQQTLTFLGINLLYALVTLLVSVFALVIIDKYVFTKIDFIEEIKKGNIAASIFQSTILIFIGLVVAVSMS
ncbi:DUF350 domain-containing protein [Aliikangiella coralliicola]|uniref:DUF350 domain-containing protein n=1 Tax=Aliikangiella coralliicola TaxID=2592383 RepID=A0A545U7C7_9GAMM|nr:DUF350 domain-containing protein [Aliikangiella coralliicola]TQV85364.1 DUF350 domain-containing protein [Aliikangiella coralliicola]